MFKSGSRRNELREAHSASLPPLEHPLDELRVLIHTTVSDQNQLQDYDKALDELRKSLILSYYQGINDNGGDLFIWIFRATEGFLQLLRSQTPESLVILAYFCVLLKRSEHKYVTKLQSPIFNVWCSCPFAKQAAC